MVAEPDGEVSF